MSNFVRYLISDFLDIVQVEDLRNNLNAINNATREVLLESNLTKLVCVNVFFPKLKCPTFFFFFAGERIWKIASNYADNSYSG